ncbi:conserved hypothetical protein [Ricinus communis]|uniref:RNase H type-1 domain-containing protein n=1 Tax=Ricinus communis TaxID=3988 RepID=B9RSV6_RICCO|nr:conserved hypothetical protein [Ricinus communis]
MVRWLILAFLQLLKLKYGQFIMDFCWHRGLVMTELNLRWILNLWWTWLQLNEVSMGVNRNLICACKDLLNRKWRVQVNHIFREGNFVADWLANHLLTRERGVHYVEQLHVDLQRLLEADAVGVAWVRAVRV